MNKWNSDRSVSKVTQNDIKDICVTSFVILATFGHINVEQGTNSDLEVILI